VRLIVTRPAAQAADWVAALRALGCDAQALPLIDIAPPADPQPVIAAWQRLTAQALVMFVSANAVQHFFARAPAGLGWPASTRAAATGPGTAAALRAAGVPEAAVVEPAADAASFDSEALWARLATEDWTGRSVLVVRGEDGRDWLADALRARGAAVEFVAAYRRRAPQPDAAQAELLGQALARPERHLWLFSSSEAVGHLPALAPGADWSRSAALATHPRIAAAARALGLGTVGAVASDIAAVAARVAAWPSIQFTVP
jgi:uroporphyrinogen-III synthase